LSPETRPLATFWFFVCWFLFVGGGTIENTFCMCGKDSLLKIRELATPIVKYVTTRESATPAVTYAQSVSTVECAPHRATKNIFY